MTLGATISIWIVWLQTGHPAKIFTKLAIDRKLQWKWLPRRKLPFNQNSLPLAWMLITLGCSKASNRHQLQLAIQSVAAVAANQRNAVASGRFLLKKWPDLLPQIMENWRTLRSKPISTKRVSTLWRKRLVPKTKQSLQRLAIGMKALPRESTLMWMWTSERNELSKPAKIMIPIFQTKPPRYSKLPAMQFKSRQLQMSLANTTLSSKTKAELQPLQFKSIKISTSSSKTTKSQTMPFSTTKWRTHQRCQCRSEDCLQPK